MKKGCFAIIFVALLLAPIVSAYSSPSSPSGFVNDYAQTMSAGARQQLEEKLVQFEKDTSNEVSVAIIESLQDDTIENFAEKLFQEWEIGKKGKDNGVLLLISKNDRKIKIEVGYGLEGALTDAQSFWIIENILRPAFRQSDFDGGITAAVDKIIGATKGEYVPTEDRTLIEDSRDSGWRGSGLAPIDVIKFAIFLIFFGPIWLGSILARSKSWWLGGIIGAATGVILLFVLGTIIGIAAILFLTPFGLVFDYLVSRNYQQRKASGQKPSWWAGGGFGGHGGFGGGSGFGDGRSGGGGSSGSW